MALFKKTRENQKENNGFTGKEIELKEITKENDKQKKRRGKCTAPL